MSAHFRCARRVVFPLTVLRWPVPYATGLHAGGQGLSAATHALLTAQAHFWREMMLSERIQEADSFPRRRGCSIHPHTQQ